MVLDSPLSLVVPEGVGSRFGMMISMLLLLLCRLMNAIMVSFDDGTRVLGSTRLYSRRISWYRPDNKAKLEGSNVGLVLSDWLMVLVVGFHDVAI